MVQFGYSLPIAGATVALEQKLPVPLAQFSLMAQKVGDMEVHSPQIAEHRDMPVQAQTFIVGKGPAVPAGGTSQSRSRGCRIQPVWPRNVALGLAMRSSLAACGPACVARKPTPGTANGAGAWMPGVTACSPSSWRSRNSTGRARSSPDRYATRRTELVAALERVYAEIDDEAAA